MHMHIETKDLLNSIMESFDRVSYVESSEIPNIDLYMDQVTTFYGKKLPQGHEISRGGQGHDKDHDKQLCKK